MALGHSPKIVTNGLVGYWDAGNTKSYPGSGTAWTDLSGTGNNGTLRNSPTYSSSDSGKFIFNGTTQDADCGNSASINFGTGDFTVSAWFRRFTSAVNNSRMLSKAATGDGATAADPGFCFFGSDGGLVFAVNPTGPRSFVGSGVFLYSLNQWVNVVGLVERSGTMRMYKNSVLVDSTTAPSGSVSGTRSLFIGSNIGVGQFWPGEISNVSIHNRALSNSEISQNFNALRGRFGI